MSDYGYGSSGHCPDCGGSNDLHFNDCTYDGINRGTGRSGGASSDTWKWICVIMMIIFGGLCPPIGAFFFLLFMLSK